jgi:hypothetical protein
MGLEIEKVITASSTIIDLQVSWRRDVGKKILGLLCSPLLTIIMEPFLP